MEVKQGRRLKIAVHAFLSLPYFLTRDFTPVRIAKQGDGKMSRYGLRGRFGMVLQDIWLYEGAIRENLV